jgi:protein-arginine kinase activator protein McsA
MHRALAEAQIALIQQDPDEAIERLKAAQSTIEEHYRQQEQPDLAGQDPAMSNLRALEQQIRKQHKIEQTLHEQLALAIETEQFEKAAELRDRLRKKGGRMKGEAGSGGA